MLDGPWAVAVLGGGALEADGWVVTGAGVEVVTAGAGALGAVVAGETVAAGLTARAPGE